VKVSILRLLLFNEIHFAVSVSAIEKISELKPLLRHVDQLAMEPLQKIFNFCRNHKHVQRLREFLDVVSPKSRILPEMIQTVRQDMKDRDWDTRPLRLEVDTKHLDAREVQKELKYYSRHLNDKKVKGRNTSNLVPGFGNVAITQDNWKAVAKAVNPGFELHQNR